MDILIVKFSCTAFHEVVLGWPSQSIGCILSSLETRSKTGLKKKKLESLKENAVLFFKNLNIIPTEHTRAFFHENSQSQSGPHVDLVLDYILPYAQKRTLSPS